MLFRRSFSKPHRCASAQGDAFTALPHFEFGLRLQFCSQHPPLQNASRTEASLQSSTATSEFRLGSEVEVEVKRLHFRMQNAECRVRKKMKWDSVNSNSDFDFRAGL